MQVSRSLIQERFKDFEGHISIQGLKKLNNSCNLIETKTDLLVMNHTNLPTEKYLKTKSKARIFKHFFYTFQVFQGPVSLFLLSRTFWEIQVLNKPYH